LKIEIKNLSFKAIIGILDFERVTPQRVIIDIILEYSYIKDNFIDYVTVKDIAKKTVIEGEFQLLEEAIEQIFYNIKNSFSNINYIEIKISKPDILNDCTVSLSNSYQLS